MKILQTALAATALTTAAFCAQAEELRLATTAPEKSPWGAWIAEVAEKTSTLSNGELTLEVFYGGQLGDEQATMNLLTRGRVDMAVLTTSAASLLEPGLEAIHMPFAWANDAEFDCAVDNHLLPMIGEMLDGRGATLIGSIEIPPFVMFAKEAINTPADLAERDWRANPTRVSTGFLNAMGANAVPLGNSDMVTSLQTGAIDGVVTSGLFGVAIGIDKLAPNILLTQHTRVVGTLMASEQTWKGLSDEHKAILTEASGNSAALRDSVRGAERFMLDGAVKNGASVTELNDNQRAEWQAAAEASYDTLLGEIGGKSTDVWAVMQSAKAACAN